MFELEIGIPFGLYASMLGWLHFIQVLKYEVASSFHHSGLK
jgi:hypothetical protein